MGPPAAALCDTPDCPVATSGKCLLGKDPVESCPHYGHVNVADAELAPQENAESEKPKPIDICSGDVMHLEHLVEFARAKVIRTVALLGEHRAGKTTLLASIYEMFCKGPFAGMTFAGSRTLVGFAKRHHRALLNSGSVDPAPGRTSRDDPVAFYHLALARDGLNPMHLIMSDRSGEIYEDARIDTDLIQNLSELHQADRACFLLDTAKLGEKDLRAAYTRQFKQLIHALHDNGALVNVKAIEVLATKIDLARTQADAEEQVKFLGDYEAQVSAEFKARGLDVGCYRVCALPKSDTSVGFIGLDDTVRRWTAASPMPDIAPSPIDGEARQIDRLVAKW